MQCCYRFDLIIHRYYKKKKKRNYNWLNKMLVQIVRIIIIINILFKSHHELYELGHANVGHHSAHLYHYHVL